MAENHTAERVEVIETAQHRPVLVLGGTGKVGRRLVERLTRLYIPVRIGSRSAGLPFEWDELSTWGHLPAARDFTDYARVTAATGVWTPTDQPNLGSAR